MKNTISARRAVRIELRPADGSGVRGEVFALSADRRMSKYAESFDGHVESRYVFAAIPGWAEEEFGPWTDGRFPTSA